MRKLPITAMILMGSTLFTSPSKAQIAMPYFGTDSAYTLAPIDKALIMTAAIIICLLIILQMKKGI